MPTLEHGDGSGDHAEYSPLRYVFCFCGIKYVDRIVMRPLILWKTPSEKFESRYRCSEKIIQHRSAHASSPRVPHQGRCCGSLHLAGYPKSARDSSWRVRPFSNDGINSRGRECLVLPQPARRRDSIPTLSRRCRVRILLWIMMLRWRQLIWLCTKIRISFAPSLHQFGWCSSIGTDWVCAPLFSGSAQQIYLVENIGSHHPLETWVCFALTSLS